VPSNLLIELKVVDGMIYHSGLLRSSGYSLPHRLRLFAGAFFVARQQATGPEAHLSAQNYFDIEAIFSAKCQNVIRYRYL